MKTKAPSKVNQPRPWRLNRTGVVGSGAGSVQKNKGGDGGAVEIGRGRRKLSAGEVISGGVVYLWQWQQRGENL